jgi:predicted RNA-binding Zn-ribbon protein involved in translation (DUF1610 family)
MSRGAEDNELKPYRCSCGRGLVTPGTLMIPVDCPGCGRVHLLKRQGRRVVGREAKESGSGVGAGGV